jgi:murein L,D-transpeptidase YcbB/YkuD
VIRCLRGSIFLCLLALATGASAGEASPKPDDEGRALEALYARNAPPLWLRDGRLSPQAEQLLAVLQAAEQFGLGPKDYATPMALTAAAGSRFDRELSLVALRIINDLHRGRVSPRAAKFDLREHRPAFDLVTAVRRLAGAADVRGELETHEPQSRYYQLLKQQLTIYRTLAADRARTPLPALTVKAVKPGERYAGTEALRALLVAVGDLSASQHVDHGTLDPELVAGLSAFQARHGLTPDGVLGKRTFAALSIPLTQRVRQIELALERWRWLPPLPAPLIVVNVPQFMLYAFPASNNLADILEVPVIVGQEYPRTQTPMFSSAIETVVFRPYWNVPYGIMKRELLPSIRSDTSYLQRHDMEIVRGQSDNAQVVAPTPENLDALADNRLRLRQRPGPSNALGLIKFVLPNAYTVYLHGTPAVELFNASRRAFSHGCIRVSDPVALGEFVLKNAAEPWDAARIELAMCGTQTLRVPLVKPLPVLILYGTAVATERRGMLFFDDVYGHDRVLERLLRLPPVTSQP